MRDLSPSPLLRCLQAAVLAAGLAGAAIASAQAPTPGMAPGAGHGMHAASAAGHDGMHGKMTERREQRMAQRLESLRQKLSISAEQEAAWAAWTNALRANGPMPAADRAKMRAEMAQLTTPERIDRMRTLRAQHQSRMDQRAEATKRFYAALNAEQQKVFDQMTAQRGHHGGAMHRHHHG